MPESNGIVKNVSFLLVSDILGKILSFFLVIAIARYLGEAGLGKYSFAFAFAGLFSIFADFGLTTYVTREIAKDKEHAKRHASNMLSLKLMLALATLILPIIIIHFIEKSPEVIHTVYIVSAATALLNLTSVFGTLFAAYEKLQYSALTNIIERVITVGLGLLLLFKGAGLIGLVTAYLISYFAIAAIAAAIAYRKTTSFGLKWDIESWKQMLKSSMPFWFTTIFITIYFRIDTVLLQMMTSYEAVGWYNAAYKALDALYFIPGAVILAVFPVMSRLHIDNKKMLQTLYRRTFYYLLILAIPIAVGITILSGRIITFIYGGKFAESVPALQVLIWAEAIIFVSALAGYLLNAINKQLTFTYVTGLAALLKIGMNLALIPRYGYMGAAISTVITELTVLILLYHYANKNGYGIEVSKTLVKPIIAALTMASAILLLDSLNIFILIPLGAAVYFATLFILKGIGKDEINILKGLRKSL